MRLSTHNKEVLRRLAAEYAGIAAREVHAERIERYFKTNAMDPVRPVVLIHEVPWGEIRDAGLTNVCAPELEWLETHLRRTVYQWTHFQADLVVPPVFRVEKRIAWRRGIGIQVRDQQIQSATGTYAAAHAYADQLQTDEDLSRLHEPELRYDREASESALAVAESVFDGLMPVQLAPGAMLQYNIWDQIAMFRGVDNLLMDLAMRPDFMHRTARRFMDLARSEFRQLEEQDLLDPYPLLLHCTVACARELPAPDFDGHARARDVWGRCSAQIFGSVSPAMHDEFDLAYNQDLFGDCGLLYYGCCEPMDRKIDILRNRFKNLRKVSITPWADPWRAAEQMGRDLVMAAKPNPAFVSGSRFNPDPVRQEIRRYCDACKANGTPLEFVLKDISTISGNPRTLTEWADTVESVIGQYDW